QNKIYSDQGIQSHQISVQAANGVVTLNGSVSSDVERNAAANDAGSIDGVRAVINNLEVQQAEATPPAPKEVAPPPPAPKSAPNQKQVAKNTRHHRNTESDRSMSGPTLANSMPPAAPEPEVPPAQSVAPPQPPPPPLPPQKVTIPAGTQLS